MKVVVIGSRNLLIKDISIYIPSQIKILISGGARGIDILAESYANKNTIPKLIYKTDYLKYGKIAALIKNKLIVENSDIVIAIWDNVSRGTKYTIDYAKKIGRETKIYIIK